MILARKLLMAAGITPPTGQQIYSSSGTFSFIVPAGVYSICVACVGASGDAAASPSSASGGGGACAWTNDIPVTPGETLTVQVGSSRSAGSSAAAGQSRIRRGSTDLVMAMPGMAYDWSGGQGGQAANCVGANRFSGRDGGTQIGGSAAGLSGTLPAALFGYGGTGVVFGSSSWSTQTPLGNAEQRRSGASAGGGGAGGGSIAASGKGGAVCIIWGPGRGFSTTSTSY